MIHLFDGIPELEYAFKHAFTRDVAYSSLLQERRKALHRLIGAAVEELYTDRLPEQYEVLAHHYSQGEDWPKALDYLVKSAKKAAYAYATQDALAYFDRALQVCDRLSDVPVDTLKDIYAGRANACVAIGDRPGMMANYTQLREFARAAGDHTAEGIAINGIANSHFQAHEFDLAEATAQEALAIADEEDDVTIRAEAIRILSGLDCMRGNLHTAEDKATEAVRLMREAGQTAVDALLSNLSFNYCWRGLYEQARHLAKEAIEIQEQLWHRSHWRVYLEGLVLASGGRYKDAIATLRDAITLCQRVGTKGFQSRSWNTLGWIYIELCDWERAIECNQNALDLALTFEDTGSATDEIIINAQINLADCASGIGKREQARQELEELYTSLPRRHEWMKWRYSQRLMHSLGEIVLAEGDTERALALADECLALAEPTESRKNIVKGRRLRGQVFLAQDKLTEAEQEISIALEIAKQIGNPPQLWKTYVALGDLRQAQGRQDDAHQAYCDAITVIEDVAAGLDDESLRNTFMNSSHVQEIRQKADRSG